MIAILGAGISGLSVAYHLEKAGKEYQVFEASETPGGNIATKIVGEYKLELGANSLLCDEEMFSFLAELGIDKEVVEASAINKSRFIYKKGKYQVLPSGPLSLMKSSFFSFSAKLKILSELFRKPHLPPTDETLSNLFKRHFGREVVDYALGPFVAGIYAGDPEKLLVTYTFPSLIAFEKEHGSLLKGLVKNAGSRKKSINFNMGMQTLPLAMAKSLKINYGTRVTKVKKQHRKFVIEVQKAGSSSQFEADHLVISLPAYETAEILKDIAPEIEMPLKNVKYPPMTVVYSAFEKDKVGFALDGFGGLNPKKENLFTAGSIWSSSVFSNRCPENEVLLTTFVGGEQYKLNASNPTELIQDKVTEELRKVFKIGAKPVFQEVKVWKYSIPQYDRFIKDAIEKTKSLENEKIFIASNWIGGVSIPDCIKKGKSIAKKLETF